MIHRRIGYAAVVALVTLVAASGCGEQPHEGVGSDGIFRITPQRPVPELRAEALAAQPPAESGQFRSVDLVELTKLDPTIKLDIRYATANNFLSTPVYTRPAAYLQRPAAEALLRVHRALASQGYGLLIHDAYRPWWVTKVFWEATPPALREFVADPAQGSRHNRGCAVDLTLYELRTGKAVSMPSVYDEMSPRAYPNYSGGKPAEREHRELLRKAMEREGFTVYETEWWHFDFKDWREYPIVNRDFAQLSGGLSEEAQRKCSHLRQPSTGQPGKDVVWMPTTDALTTKMLELAKTVKGDRVFDLGAGDGRIPIAAAKDFGATAVGVEYDADLVALAQCLVTAEGVSDKVKIERADVFDFDFSSASVVTLYLLPEINLRLRPKLLAMTPGTRIVSHSWLMDDWEPDDQVSADGAYAYLWIVPAKVAGTWTFVRSDGGERFTIQLQQSFQNITGRIASGDASRPLWRSRVRGDQIEFAYAAESSITTVVGTVSQDKIEARVTRNGSASSYEGKRL